MSGRTLTRRIQDVPVSEPAKRFAHILGRAGIGKANITIAAGLIKVDPGGRGNIRFRQHLCGERETVVSEIADVGVDVERPVGRD